MKKQQISRLKKDAPTTEFKSSILPENLKLSKLESEDKADTKQASKQPEKINYFKFFLRKPTIFDKSSIV